MEDQRPEPSEHHPGKDVPDPPRLVSSHQYHKRGIPAATAADIHHTNHELQASTPKGSRWVFEKYIYNNPHIEMQQGRETERILHLFALVDDDGIVQQRITVKIIGDDDLARLTRTINKEVAPHKRLTTLGCEYIVKLLGSSFRQRDVAPHLGYFYMEYAPFGDVFEFVRKTSINAGKQIPEPFVWVTFRSLVEALHAMQTGVVLDDTTRPESIGVIRKDWVPVINPDIKLENVVLGAPQDRYPTYKTVKMIDFGQVFGEHQLKNGLCYKKYSMGTEGVVPPEVVWPPIPEFDMDPVGIHSEIYTVGLIICSLMQGRSKERITPAKPMYPADYTGCYSQALEKLVTRCLEDNWLRRPGLTELIRLVNTGFASWEAAYGSASGGYIPHYMRCDGFAKEEIPIGSAAPETWGGPRKRKPQDEATADKEPGSGPKTPGEAGNAEAPSRPSKKARTDDAESAANKLSETRALLEGWGRPEPGAGESKMPSDTPGNDKDRGKSGSESWVIVPPVEPHEGGGEKSRAGVELGGRTAPGDSPEIPSVAGLSSRDLGAVVPSVDELGSEYWVDLELGRARGDGTPSAGSLPSTGETGKPSVTVKEEKRFEMGEKDDERLKTLLEASVKEFRKVGDSSDLEIED